MEFIEINKEIGVEFDPTYPVPITIVSPGGFINITFEELEQIYTESKKRFK